VSYDPATTLGSLLLATLAVSSALYVASREMLSWRRLAIASVLTGFAIAGMHYLGMMAMQMQPRVEYNPWLFSASTIAAVVASAAAVWFAFQLRSQATAAALLRKLLAALIVGGAFAGAHYLAMAGAMFAEGAAGVAGSRIYDTAWIAGTVGGLALTLLFATLLVSGFVALRPTIRARLVFLVLGCMLPVSLMAVAFVFFDYHRDQVQVASDTVATARVISEVLDNDLVSVESGLQALATSPFLAANNYSGFYLQSKEVLRELHANAIALSDAYGQQLIDTRRPYGEALPLYDNPAQALRIFETARPVISDFFVSHLDGTPLIAVGVPVRRDGTVVYQISASIFPDRLSKILIRQQNPRNWIVAVYDSNGTVVARTHEIARFLGKKGAAAVRQRLAEVDEGSVETTTLEGIPVLTAFSRSSVSKWTVVIGIPTSSFSSELLNTLWALLLALAVLLTVSFALAWYIGGSISRSIHALTEPALRLGSGASVEVPPLGLVEADEVGQALTKASALLSQAQHDAQHDALTGLANRALFNEIVRQQLTILNRSNGNLAVLYIDLDGFKAVNDTHGHQVGDALLKAVAARIQVKIREGDLAARLGGDEFAAILIQPGAAGAATVAGKLVESLSIAFPLGSISVSISASIGVALYPGPATTTESLLASADDAMYKAKKAGKRRFVVAPG
jgi:diguanylate cyclase (GGDEF)-like protein